MRLERFFEKFELFADAPDAVTGMRKLVLELAMQGRLVCQDPNEVSAEELLRQIELTRSRIGKTANGRKLEFLPPVEPDDSPFEIPHRWQWCRLGTLGLISSSSRVHEKDWTSNGVPFLRAREIVKLAKTGRVDNDLYITEEHFQRLAADGLIPEPNDLMITGVGTIGVPYVVKDSDRFYFKDASVLIFKNWFGLYPDFLHIVMQSPYWIKEVHRESMGTTVHTLTIIRAKQTPIPLPPLAEQKRIVAKVDELMALCDQLETQQQERNTRHAALARASLARFADAPTTANLEKLLFHPSYTISPADLRKSILTLAVQGKLVPQDSNDESVDDLLARSLTERLKLKRTTATEVQLIDGKKALGYDIPASWQWQALDDVLVSGPTNGVSPKAVDYETPVRSLTLSATTSGRFNGKHSKFITMDIRADSDLWLHDGDILVQRGNTIEYVGVSAVYRGAPNCFVYPDLMMKLRVSSLFDVGFIHLAMSQEAARNFLRARASGTSGSMPKINQTTLKSLPLPIPPIAEQHRIVAKTDQLMALVDQLEAQLAESRMAAKNLMEAVVSELTAQE